MEVIDSQRTKEETNFTTAGIPMVVSDGCGRVHNTYTGNCAVQTPSHTFDSWSVRSTANLIHIVSIRHKQAHTGI